MTLMELTNYKKRYMTIVRLVHNGRSQVAHYDTIIRNGLVIDGLRNPRRKADVGIVGGKVVEIGKIRTRNANEELDAEGLIVAPGFVDLHTHYDAQLFWDPYCTISGLHGVTSVAIGNCGFGFAPVLPEQRDRSMKMMTRVEQIPYEAMAAALPWTWESFPEFLDAVEATPKGVNILPYVPANPLLVYVMGLDAAKSRAPTEAETARMRQLLGEAMDAGACGWSAQVTPPGPASGQRDFDGTPFPSDVMTDETMLALCGVLGERDEGFVQITLATTDPAADMRHLEAMAATSGRPIIFNALTTDERLPELHRTHQAWLNACRTKGLPVYGQGVTGENGFDFDFTEWNMWDAHEPWREALLGTPEERYAKLADDAARQRLKDDPPFLFPMETLTLLTTETSEEKQFENLTLAEIAKRKNKDLVDSLLDIVLSDRLRSRWWVPFSNTDEVLLRELVVDPYVVPGVSDGGAHTKMFTGGKYPTEHISKYVRDFGWVDLEEMHWKLSALPAHIAGFRDRGTIQVGAPADIIVYDLASLTSLPDELVADLPGGDWRRIRRAEGYRYILVNGQITFEDGECTNRTPGALLRHGMTNEGS